ncbi:PLP-dependent transferase [Clavulina sp. PMI_390]|nr:PLP-dependent transferase [Clavulina sp. PMI_390]
MIEISPRAGEFVLREEDILSVIKENGSSIALVLFSGVQYYTGQWFPMESITKAGHAEGAIVGWDLAHAIGNVYPLQLHDWDVDFAVWCTYKYLNSGPGGIGGLFVHENWDTESPAKLHGWWGHDQQTRFRMPYKFKQIPGAAGYQQSNPAALLVAALMGSLELFDRLPPLSPGEAGMTSLRQKSLMLTNWLEHHLRKSKHFFEAGKIGELFPSFDVKNAGIVLEAADAATKAEVTAGKKLDPRFTIITPSPFTSALETSPTSVNSFRGAQLSLLWPAGAGTMHRVLEALKRRGVIGDERDPDVIRLSPAPLYNSFGDCERCLRILNEVLDEVAATDAH